MTDPYSVLGVARNADAAAIKAAYRKLAKELHPDRNKDNPSAAERFKAVSAAYDILGDDSKRGQFDRGEIDGDGNPRAPQFGGFGGFGGSGANGGTHFEFRGDPDDLFESLFSRGGGFGTDPFARGGFQQRPRKGADRAYRLAVSFIDAALGRPQRITLASGKTIDLKLKPGVEDGMQMRLAGQGDAGPGGTGDAIVTITVTPHRFFTRDGDDIRLDLPVRLDEAVLGAKVRVPTVDGPVMLSVGPDVTSGKLLRLKGKGWARKDGTRGDQIVRLLIDVPAGDEKLKEAVRAWARDATHDPRASFGEG